MSYTRMIIFLYLYEVLFSPFTSNWFFLMIFVKVPASTTEFTLPITTRELGSSQSKVGSKCLCKHDENLLKVNLNTNESTFGGSRTSTRNDVFGHIITVPMQYRSTAVCCSAKFDNYNCSLLQRVEFDRNDTYCLPFNLDRTPSIRTTSATPCTSTMASSN